MPRHWEDGQDGTDFTIQRDIVLKGLADDVKKQD